mgnify:CR=1 FL=1
MAGGEGSANEALFEVLQFDERGVIPALLEDYRTRKPLAFEWMSRAAIDKTIETGLVHLEEAASGELRLRGGYHRRARLEGILIECQGRCLVLRVFQHIGACGRGYASCFHRAYDLTHRQVMRVEDPTFRGD